MGNLSPIQWIILTQVSNQGLLHCRWILYELSYQESPKVFIELITFFSISGSGIDLNYYEVEWFALETNQDHSVIFEVAPKHFISDSCYSTSSMGFVPTVVDIMVI